MYYVMCPVHVMNVEHHQVAVDAQTKPTNLASLLVGCYCLNPPSPFIITQPESRYSFYHPTESKMMSQSKHAGCEKLA